jgi:hypothetical protein
MKIFAVLCTCQCFGGKNCLCLHKGYFELGGNRTLHNVCTILRGCTTLAEEGIYQSVYSAKRKIVPGSCQKGGGGGLGGPLSRSGHFGKQLVSISLKVFEHRTVLHGAWSLIMSHVVLLFRCCNQRR